MKRTCLGALALTLAAAGAFGAAMPDPCDRFVGKLPNLSKPLCGQAIWRDLLRWTAAKIHGDAAAAR